MMNQSICARFAVMSRTEKPWSSKSMYLMCGLLALRISSTPMLVVRGGVPVMSHRLLDVTEVPTNSTPTELRVPAYVALSAGRSEAHPEWMSPVTNSASVTPLSRRCSNTSRRSSV